MAAADDEERGSAASAPRIKIRIESLSDLVFGLALSIGSLVLIGREPQSGEALAVSVLLFGFGFLIVVMVWLGYSRTMAVLPAEVPLALYTNLFLLFCVALEPYLFYVLQSVQAPGLLDAASVAYALDVGGMFFLLSALAYLVVKEEEGSVERGRQRLHPLVLARFRRSMKVLAVIGMIFVVSALPIFWVDTPIGVLRFYLWAPSSLMFLMGRGARPSARPQGRLTFAES
jgi:uncharacterized membrane protein